MLTFMAAYLLWLYPRERPKTAVQQIKVLALLALVPLADYVLFGFMGVGVVGILWSAFLRAA
jgi:hypothetical protein